MVLLHTVIACSKAQRAAVSSAMYAPAVGGCELHLSVEHACVLEDASGLLSLLKIYISLCHALEDVKAAYTVP